MDVAVRQRAFRWADDNYQAGRWTFAMLDGFLDALDGQPAGRHPAAIAAALAEVDRDWDVPAGVLRGDPPPSQLARRVMEGEMPLVHFYWGMPAMFGRTEAVWTCQKAIKRMRDYLGQFGKLHCRLCCVPLDTRHTIVACVVGPKHWIQGQAKKCAYDALPGWVDMQRRAGYSVDDLSAIFSS